ncbi:MAG TPA: DUF6152 family protein [Terriglobia bacterium]|nr:DUF6152 family protein [Terriglobia bacterium]
MKVSRVACLIIGASWFIAASVLAAHHSSSGLDRNKAVTLTGVISELEWTNPHIRIHIDVKSEGKTENWTLGWAAVNAVTRSGMFKDTLKAGDQITAQVYLFATPPASAASSLVAEAGCISFAGRNFAAGYGPPCASTTESSK